MLPESGRQAAMMVLENVTGVDSLIRAMSLLEHEHKFSIQMHNMLAYINSMDKVLKTKQSQQDNM